MKVERGKQHSALRIPHSAFQPSTLILALLLIAGFALAGQDKSLVRKTEHFTVYGWSSAYLLVEKAAVRAEIAYADLSRELGLKRSPSKRVAVCVYKTHQEFVLATGAGRRSIILGQATYPMEIIDVDGSELYRPMEEVLDHEIAHIVVGRVLGQAVEALPRWMNEGIATHFSSPDDTTDIALLSDAVGDDRLIPLKSLSRAFGNPKTSGLAYAQSGAVVGFLESTYGRGTTRRILCRTAETGDFEAAVRTVTGVPVAELYSSWEKRMYKTYAAWRWARQLPEVIWAAMALIVILAFIAMMRKKRRFARRYEEEDFFARKWPPD